MIGFSRVGSCAPERPFATGELSRRRLDLAPQVDETSLGNSSRTRDMTSALECSWKYVLPQHVQKSTVSVAALSSNFFSTSCRVLTRTFLPCYYALRQPIQCNSGRTSAMRVATQFCLNPASPKIPKTGAACVR